MKIDVLFCSFIGGNPIQDYIQDEMSHVVYVFYMHTGRIMVNPTVQGTFVVNLDRPKLELKKFLSESFQLNVMNTVCINTEWRVRFFKLINFYVGFVDLKRKRDRSQEDYQLCTDVLRLYCGINTPPHMLPRALYNYMKRELFATEV